MSKSILQDIVTSRPVRFFKNKTRQDKTKQNKTKQNKEDEFLFVSHSVAKPMLHGGKTTANTIHGKTKTALSFL